MQATSVERTVALLCKPWSTTPKTSECLSGRTRRLSQCGCLRRSAVGFDGCCWLLLLFASAVAADVAVGGPNDRELLGPTLIMEEGQRREEFSISLRLSLVCLSRSHLSTSIAPTCVVYVPCPFTSTSRSEDQTTFRAKGFPSLCLLSLSRGHQVVPTSPPRPSRRP